MPIHWPTAHSSILDRFPSDITLLLADQLADADAYGSLAALCATSHELKRVLQPFLRDRKKKVWMRLDDWSWDEMGEGEERYAGIGIIECTPLSPLPINLQQPTYVKHPSSRFTTEQRLLRSHCTPWMLIYKGHPHRSILTLYERFFPAIKLVKIIVDSGAFHLVDIDNLPRIKGPPEATVVVNKFATYLLEKRMMVAKQAWDVKDDKEGVGVPQLRYLRLDGHGGIDAPAHGRITSSLRARTRNGFEYRREEWSYYGDDEDLSEAEAYCLYQLALPDEPRQVFTNITIDIHIDTASIPSPLFITDDRLFPRGYHIFADASEQLAQQHLAPGEESRLHFRLFTRHGNPLASECEPVFESTYTMSPCEYGKLRTVKRCVDEDFAGCRAREGCRRCLGQGEGVVEI